MASPEYNLLVHNFITILKHTELKRNEDLDLSFLDDITRDIVRFYAKFFTQGDKKEALKILDQQTSIDGMALAKASFFFGCSVAIIVLILIENLKHPIESRELYLN